ncbi:MULTISPECIES: ISAs1 family transposase [Moorena]|uniref:Transposase, IS4 family n=1 Tax=Moorena producens 3L TaxID=489825 RepID=F4Y312_9CYAN|nr:MULTISPECIES: ISAs1 family transposase [Moorena]EGJ29006.1 transposase, IS4 family [Moorena producens 3L]NEP33975.1 ISAs1 family transposase [Moorena sp. SIO3B2]NEP69965.1 ISAs1 family transposase [Moorena sp. SIO3A5]NER91938.1 ISAs1 family transposase [Moorena sp. SIO3A2]NES41784.1 ISAs1 family transposase [Moorena sp. SIO2C4]
MNRRPKTTIFEHFSDLKDPRVDRTKLHKLIDIITITICAVISGADTWVDIELYGKTKYQWLKKFLELPNGIPSHDTFARVFAKLNPEQLQSCFLKWIQSISQLTSGEIVAIDGKTLRHSYQKSSHKPAIHMVSAWATANQLVLGQVKVDEKSNEITAIPKLLKVLALKGCIVTIDAMGCQKEIVLQIVAQDADYVITLKKNQCSLYERVENLFNSSSSNQKLKGIKTNFVQSKIGHGREERRYYQMLSNIKEEVDPSGDWLKLNSIGLVDYFRQEKDGTTSFERRYYVSSLTNNAELLAKAIRGHWGIENQLHWVLDVQFSEDDSRIRKDNAPENLAIIRQIALNLLKQESTETTGIKTKRKKAGWDNDYLLKVLGV